jgi:hypothetical protein
MRGEGREVAGAERGREQRVVADLEMAVERQVVGGQRQIGVEQQLQAALGGGVEGARGPAQKSPWCTRTRSAPSARARVNSSALALTPVTTVWISSFPGTCRPFGP